MTATCSPAWACAIRTLQQRERLSGKKRTRAAVIPELKQKGDRGGKPLSNSCPVVMSNAVFGFQHQGREKTKGQAPHLQMYTRERSLRIKKFVAPDSEEPALHPGQTSPTRPCPTPVLPGGIRPPLSARTISASTKNLAQRDCSFLSALLPA